MACNTTEDKLGLFGSAHTSSKGMIIYCNSTFEGGDGGFDSDECSDDGESRCVVCVLCVLCVCLCVCLCCVCMLCMCVVCVCCVCVCKCAHFRPDKRGGGGWSTLRGWNLTPSLCIKHIVTSVDNCMGEPNGRQLWSVNTAGSCQVDPTPGHVILVVIPCRSPEHLF